jgi:prepilin-type N-terminal cleavage/methylation domain-containing protein
MKRAFTLIELLVVIAIIAILAAILFPVFAQAKASAKGAASLSNDKQLALSQIMYAADADDMAVPYMYWDDSNTAVVRFGGLLYTPWTALLVPYMKNTDIFADPLDKSVPPVGAGWGTNAWNCIHPQYGYNYTTLSPVFGNIPASQAAPLKPQPVSLTAVGRPADIIMFSAVGSYSQWFWWYGDYTMVSVGMSDAPDCNGIPQWCFQNWGVGGNISSATANDDVEGAQTGWNSVRIGNQHTMTFVDGHAKRMTPASAAVGTTYYKNIPSGNVLVNKASVYRWNLQ